MSARGRISAYLDCSLLALIIVLSIPLLTTTDSPYSLFAITWLRKNKDALAEHGIDVECVTSFNVRFLKANADE